MQRKHTILYIITYSLLAVSAIGFIVSLYKLQHFGTSQIDEIIFYLKNGIGDGQSDTFIAAAAQYSIYAAALLALLLVPVITKWRTAILSKIPRRLAGDVLRSHLTTIRPVYLAWYSVVVCTGALISLGSSFSVVAYASSVLQTSTFYETHYVDPKTTNIVFPAKKRNLIYIYLESMENTVASKAHGGMRDTSVIPELEQLALQPGSISFSHQASGLGGARQAAGTHWTVAGITAQSGGIPLKNNLLGSKDGNYMSSYDKFLPGAFTLGDVLQRQGYNQTFMLGSKASFGGRDKLFSQHGNYTIYDYEHAKKAGKFPSDYYVWWGYEDKKLFHYAKQELTRLSQEPAPFNFQMLTVDTHFTNGYADETCQKPFTHKYDNVHACASKMVANFIHWITQQPFYADTTIIITGDHLGMQTSYYNEAIDNKPYERTIYNAFINSAVTTTRTHNRQFTSFDMYPTTLAALGATIQGDRLALGTNLFSAQPTLLESYGGNLAAFNAELGKRSHFYERRLLLNTP